MKNLEKVCEQVKVLDALTITIERTTEQDTLIELLKQSQSLSRMMIEELITYSMKRGEKYISLADSYQSLADSYQKAGEDIRDLCDVVEDERTLNDNLFDNICLGMLVSPKETFEMMLKHVEREEKIADATGGSWKWSYKFSLIPRLKMAFQLIFG